MTETRKEQNKPTTRERIEKIIEDSKLYQGFGSSWYIRMSLKNQLTDVLLQAGLVFKDEVEIDEDVVLNTLRKCEHIHEGNKIIRNEVLIDIGKYAKAISIHAQEIITFAEQSKKPLEKEG